MQLDPTHYTVLQVREDASLVIIKAAHRELMKSLHPDVNPESAAQAAAVNLARYVLGDSGRRDTYDQELQLERQVRSEQAQRHSAENHTSARPGRDGDPVASEVWGEEVPWSAQGRTGSASTTQAPGTPPGSTPPPSASDVPHPATAPARIWPRLGNWTSHIGILAWAAWWLGVQVFVAVATRIGYSDIVLALAFVVIGWLAARTRCRGGRISAPYVLWLVSGGILIGLTVQNAIPVAVLWGVIYLSWVAAAEGSHRLSTR